MPYSKSVLNGEWTKEWMNMPEFVQEDLTPYKTLSVYFLKDEDVKKFSNLVGQKITEKTKALWYPKKEKNTYANKRYVTKDIIKPKYPVYIISKGRWSTPLTSNALESMGVDYHIVIEPQEYDEYSSVINPNRILVLPFSNLGQGSIPARNWVWEHSLSIGAERHWILDDNISYFSRVNRNEGIKTTSGVLFKCAEDFVDRYENVALAGFQYDHFTKYSYPMPAYILNTRIYSCILIKNDIPYRWRGKYNEDTDLSIRALKDGWCTILFHSFIQGKAVTMTMKGGNTDELYKEDGRLQMAQSLAKQHPDVVKVGHNFGRPQHIVNYRPFKKNKLIKKQGIEVPEVINNYQMEIRII